MAQSGGVAPPPEAMRAGIGKGLVAVVVVVVLVVSFLAGVFVGKAVYGNSSLPNAQFLVVGTNIPFPPFEDYNYSAGQYVGFDVDFAQIIANASHRTLVIQNFADFSVLLTTVGAGGLDMSASAITESGTVGAGRNATMSFSIPYYSANQALLVKSGSSITCANPASCVPNDLKTLKIGVQTWTTSQGWAFQFLYPNRTTGTILNFTGVDTEVAALEAGSLDAVLIDTAPAASIAGGSGGVLKVAGAIITGKLYGFAVAHGDPEALLPVINKVINTAIADGTYGKLITKWFT